MNNNLSQCGLPQVLVETDIEGMKNVVREKLGLSPETGIRLAQSVEGRRVDLEDGK